VVTSTIAIVYCPTHIYRKGWLTIRLSLLIILNLVSEPSTIRTLSSLPPFAAGPLFTFSTWILLLSPTSPSPQVVQHSRPAIPKLLLLVPFLPHSSLHLQSLSLILPPKSLPFLTSNGNQHYNYCSFSEHSPSCFTKTYEHKLSLLQNVDEAISP
jgi:hypothetical protein